MNKLLIGYDGSPCADTALEELLQAGLPEGLEATVLSVADVWLPSDSGSDPAGPHPLPASVMAAREQAVAAVAASRTMAENAVRWLKKHFPGWQIHAESCADSPAWALLKKAGDWRPDLIVVGSHGRSMLERFFLGSVAQRVAAEAPCSVRIARLGNRSTAPLRIMVAMDGSPDSFHTIEEVSRRQWPAETSLEVITVLDPRLETSAAAPGIFRQWVKPSDKNPVEWVIRMLADAQKRLQSASYEVETRIHHGDPKSVLLAQAHEFQADCLFLGARGLQHGQGLFLGSIASAVSARAHCSVEIVRKRNVD